MVVIGLCASLILAILIFATLNILGRLSTKRQTLSMLEQSIKHLRLLTYALPGAGAVTVLGFGVAYQSEIVASGCGWIAKCLLVGIPLILMSWVLAIQLKFVTLHNSVASGELRVGSDVEHRARGAWLLAWVVPLLTGLAIALVVNTDQGLKAVLILPAAALWYQFITPRLLMRFARPVPLSRVIAVPDLAEVIAPAGLKETDVVVLDSRDPSLELGSCNAIAIGMGSSRKIVLQSDLVEKLDPRSVRAIVAHEIGHLKASHSARTILALTAYSAAIAGVIIGLTDSKSSWTGIACLLLTAGIWLIALRAHSRRLEHEADAIAATLVPAADLADALRQLEAVHGPVASGAISKLLSTHPALGARVGRLLELRR